MSSLNSTDINFCCFSSSYLPTLPHVTRQDVNILNELQYSEILLMYGKVIKICKKVHSVKIMFSYKDFNSVFSSLI